mgnify:CR=1 FL=1
MFSFLFSQLKDLHNQTALLEACDWSEDRVEDLILTAQSVIVNANKDEPEKNTIENLKKEIVDHLVENFSEAEIESILFLIEEIAESPETITETMKYEC